jgi:hypothetical protein
VNKRVEATAKALAELFLSSGRVWREGKENPAGITAADRL